MWGNKTWIRRGLDVRRITAGPEAELSHHSELGSFEAFLSRRTLVSKRLIEFLYDVCVNVKSRDEFRRDPESALARAGLSNAEKDAILSGDPEKLRMAAAISSGNDSARNGGH